MRPEHYVTDDNQEVCLETNFFVGARLIDLQDEVVEEVAEEKSPPAPITEDIESLPTVEQQPSFEEIDNVEDSRFEEIEELDIELDSTEYQQRSFDRTCEVHVVHRVLNDLHHMWGQQKVNQMNNFFHNWR